MNVRAFHFAQNFWLYGLVLVPVVTFLFAVYFKPGEALERLKSFADAHLLPHLVKNREAMRRSPVTPLVIWALIWTCGITAMAGPRWNYTDIESNKPQRNLVILLDLSKSMDTEDVKPSRLIRAREEIEDILGMNRKLSIGLIAFAAVPHMVVPLTEDMSTIRNLLPYLDTKLVYTQGSRLKPALEMAMRLLGRDPANEKFILVVSDGGFVDAAAARGAIGDGITVYALGVGTAEGAPIPEDGGSFVKNSGGQMIIARLDSDKLLTVAEAGHGIYVTADYTANDTQAMLDHMQSGIALNKKAGKSVRVWDEKFWIPALGMALLLLPWFRKGYSFPIVLFFLLTATPFHSAYAEWKDAFRNRDQQGENAYNKGDYDAAVDLFGTPYRRGVAQYKAQKYDEAAKSFSEVDDFAHRLDAEYNRGNAELLANKFSEAIGSYKSYLKERPDDKAAQHNLEIAEKLLKKQQEQQKDQQQQSGAQGQKQDNSGQNSETKDQQQNKNDQKPGDKNGSSQQSEASDQKKDQDNKQSPQEANSQNGTRKNEEDKKSAEQKPQTQQSQSEQEKGQQDKARKDQEQKQTAGQNQTPQEQPQQGDDKTLPPQKNGMQPAGNSEYLMQSKPRRPADIDADQWLSRVQSDPGPFLKNQFLIEERKANAQPEDEPW